MWPVCRLLVPNWSHNPACKEHCVLTFGRKLVCWDDSIPPSQEIIILKVLKMEKNALLKLFKSEMRLCSIGVFVFVALMFWAVSPWWTIKFLESWIMHTNKCKGNIFTESWTVAHLSSFCYSVLSWLNFEIIPGLLNVLWRSWVLLILVKEYTSVESK